MAQPELNLHLLHLCVAGRFFCLWKQLQMQLWFEAFFSCSFTFFNSFTFLCNVSFASFSCLFSHLRAFLHSLCKFSVCYFCLNSHYFHLLLYQCCLDFQQFLLSIFSFLLCTQCKEFVFVECCEFVY